MAKNAMPATKPVALLIRLPKPVKKWIERKAERNASSQNSEVVRAIREAMDSESRETGVSAAG